VGVDNDEAQGRRQHHLFRGRRVMIRDLVDAGLLEAGTILVWDLPQIGESFQVTVTETGQLQLPDGGQAGSPSRAIRDLTGKSVDGWYAWRTADKSKSIDDLRQELLQHVVQDGSNAGAAELEARQDEFLDSALKAAESGSPRQVTVRDLVGIWGARVRDFGVNERVDADLNNRGLTTRPDFRAVTLDDTVSVILTMPMPGDESPAIIADKPSDALEVVPPQATITADDDEVAWDHGLTIGNLLSASKTVSSVTPDATFEEAITRMIIEDYSQLAVMSGPRNLKGAVSWKSIAKARNANPDAKLSAAIFRADEVPYTADLISTLPLIQSKEFVFVLGADKSVTGIVTLADVVEVYGQMASPFFMIGRIDQRLRRVVEATFLMKTIIAQCDPDGERGLDGYDQLTMGDYQRILENQDCWGKLGWALDRRVFSARLKEIAQVRNNLMHFNNDPLPDDMVSMLQCFLDLLREYGS
jgi:CBS domain-containing protein